MTPRAAQELECLRLGVATRQVLELVLGRLFTVAERRLVGSDIEQLTTVAAWQRVRGGTARRAVLEIARGVGLIDDADYRWLLHEIGERDDTKPRGGKIAGQTRQAVRPHWDRATGILSLGGKRHTWSKRR